MSSSWQTTLALSPPTDSEVMRKHLPLIQVLSRAMILANTHTLTQQQQQQHMPSVGKKLRTWSEILQTFDPLLAGFVSPVFIVGNARRSMPDAYLQSDILKDIQSSQGEILVFSSCVHCN